MTSPIHSQNTQSEVGAMNGGQNDKFGAGGRPRSGHNSHQVPEFLYQLTKMLTDDNNEVIEWSQARIKVHHPDRLEAEILHKYFRHSKFASFQRQLNYFGFRKIAGKGKMSPCSYVNDAATEDMRSLLRIKRKTNGSAARKAMGERAVAGRRNAASRDGAGVVLSMPDATFNGHGRPDPRFARGMNHHQPMSAPPRPSDIQSAASLLHNGGSMTGLSQQQLQRKALSESLFFPSENALAALAAEHNRQTAGEISRYNLQQLSDQYNALSGIRDPAAAAAVLSLAASVPRPATAAMNAAVAAGQSNNLFESSQLNSLVNEPPGATSAPASRPQTTTAGDAVSRRVSSQNILNRLPSSGTIFPDSLSTASLSHLLAPNRVSSLLSLGSFLSRDPSLVDLLSQPPAPTYPVVSTGVGLDPSQLQDAGNPYRPGNGSNR